MLNKAFLWFSNTVIFPNLIHILGEGFSLQKHYEALSFQVGKLPHKRYRKKGHLASSQVEKVFLYGF